MDKLSTLLVTQAGHTAIPNSPSFPFNLFSSQQETQWRALGCWDHQPNPTHVISSEVSLSSMDHGAEAHPSFHCAMGAAGAPLDGHFQKERKRPQPLASSLSSADQVGHPSQSKPKAQTGGISIKTPTEEVSADRFPGEQRLATAWKRYF